MAEHRPHLVLARSRAARMSSSRDQAGLTGGITTLGS